MELGPEVQAPTGCAPWPHLLASSLALQRSQEFSIGDRSSPCMRDLAWRVAAVSVPFTWRTCWWAQDLGTQGYLALVWRWPQR